jgi:hypothetical protein
MRLVLKRVNNILNDYKRVQYSCKKYKRVNTILNEYKDVNHLFNSAFTFNCAVQRMTNSLKRI